MAGMMRLGMTHCDAVDTDGDGNVDTEDAYPLNHDRDIQFLTDLITQSDLSVDPLELGTQVWENYRLTELTATNEGLTGSLPPSIANIRSMIRLDLVNNNLSGTVPSGIGTLDNLIYLGLGINSFTSPLPEELFFLTELEHLDLGGNPGLTEAIPAAVGNLTKLEKLLRVALICSDSNRTGQRRSRRFFNENQFNEIIPRSRN